MQERTPRRRPYDSPLRRARMAETREQILEAASELVHEFQSWDWRPLTFRAVAARAGVGERTVYRHFANEGVLHEAVMQRLGETSGISYENLTIDDVHTIGARVFEAMSSFAAPPSVEPYGAVFAAEDERRKAALVAAVKTSAQGWNQADRLHAAAALDVLWNAPSYARLVKGWQLGPEEATRVIDWMIEVVVEAIEAGRRPSSAGGTVGTRRPRVRADVERGADADR